MIRVMARGTSSVVWIAKHKVTEELRAVKVIRKCKVNFNFLNEVEWMQNTSHPNILYFYEIFQDSKKVYVVLELCRGGDLIEEVSNSVSFSEQRAAVILE